MEISNEEHWKHVNFEGNMLSSTYAKPIKADGTVHECKASCMQERGDWDMYELKCGHKYHTRCLRIWLSKKGKLNCALCGNLPENNQNSWCCDCEDWGHATNDTRMCITQQMMFQEMNDWRPSDEENDVESEQDPNSESDADS